MVSVCAVSFGDHCQTFNQLIRETCEIRVNNPFIVLTAVPFRKLFGSLMVVEASRVQLYSSKITLNQTWFCVSVYVLMLIQQSHIEALSNPVCSPRGKGGKEESENREDQARDGKRHTKDNCILSD